MPLAAMAMTVLAIGATTADTVSAFDEGAGTPRAILVRDSSQSAVVYYGSRAGMAATIVRRQGIGTANARVELRHTSENAREFCVEYANDRSQACINRTMREVRVQSEIRANCLTGEFTTASGQRYEFRGRTRDGRPEFLIYSFEENEELDGTSVSGYGVAIDNYEALCGQRGGERTR